MDHSLWLALTVSLVASFTHSWVGRIWDMHTWILVPATSNWWCDLGHSLPPSASAVKWGVNGCLPLNLFLGCWIPTQRLLVRSRAHISLKTVKIYLFPAFLCSWGGDWWSRLSWSDMHWPESDPTEARTVEGLPGGGNFTNRAVFPDSRGHSESWESAGSRERQRFSHLTVILSFAPGLGLRLSHYLFFFFFW